MVQFYALSVIANLMVGLALCVDPEKGMAYSKAGDLVKDRTFRFSAGILALVIGIFKLVSPFSGNVPVVGDLFPATCGLVLGAVMLIEFLKDSSGLRSKTLTKLGKYLSRYRRIVGLTGIVSAVLHFFVPNVPIL